MVAEQHRTQREIRHYALRPSPRLSTEERETSERLRFSDEVELTDDEQQKAIEVAIREAKRIKASKMRQDLYNKQVYGEQVYPVFTPKEFRDLIIELGHARSIEEHWSKTFQVDNVNDAILTSLSLYFTKSPKFCETGDNFSLNKGILLVGGVGCGKTVLMDLLKVNPMTCFTQHDCVEIAMDFQKKGADVVDQYALNSKSSDKMATFGQEWLGRFFDDLGAEGIGKHFGNERNVMGDIIMQRYKLHFHSMTHFTSNLTLDQLRDSYGTRVYDRLREMCNVIEFPAAESRRK